MRTPNEILLKGNANFKIASGTNSNVFYQTDDVKKPVIATASTITPLDIAPSYLYDIETEKGNIYNFSIK
ncbi:hypothetical protein D3C85_1774370 [compost metagenome]